MSGPATASKPETQDGDIPSGLSFEEVVKNRAAPPCSLNEFMDYLFYVERRAEPLQFFLWYWDYIERWSTLLPRQKVLSPPWDPEQAAEPRSRFIKYSHKRERSLKMNKVLAIIDMGRERPSSDPTSPAEDAASINDVVISSPISSPIPSPTAMLSPTSPTKPPDWAFTIQPNRHEICSIKRHYISLAAPRRLDLPEKDREACLRAVQHTTHPSALLPAFLSAHALLRARAHPAFVRHARRNANRARLLFLRLLGALLVALGLALAAVLAFLSSAPSPSSSPSPAAMGLSAYWRLACVALWWPGLTVLVASARGVCVLLWCRGRARQVRPWEGLVDGPEDGGDGGGGGEGGALGREGEAEAGAGPGPGPGAGVVEERRGGDGRKEHKRTGTESSEVSLASTAASKLDDPLRKPSLQVFGPANDYSGQQWMARYEGKGVMGRVFDQTVLVQNKALATWQDRTVLFAVLSGGAGASVLAIISLFVPSGKVF